MLVTDEFKEKAKAKLDAASAGKFFQSNSARLLPSFERNSNSGEESADELTLGVRLGEGAFCDVKEITAIVLKTKPDGGPEDVKGGNSNGGAVAVESFLPQPKRLSASQRGRDYTDEADFPVNLFENKSEVRKYMSENYMRKNEEGKDQARYALKQLKSSNTKKHLEQGLIDISIEAKFLACLNHPNILKLRGVAGEELSPNFGLVLDRLYMTLEDKMDLWVEEKKQATVGGLCGCLGGSMDEFTKQAHIRGATTVAYDLACALRYIHGQNLVYRDIKPENAGFDVRGDIKLFDFGFCKELTRKLFDKPSGLYKLTKMTGSPPYMAPENFLGKPYGHSADVFSFGVLVWEMLHYKFAFYQYNKKDYKEIVCEKNYRPSCEKSLSARLQQLIKESWDIVPKNRPTFDRISLILRAEYEELAIAHEDGQISRSQHLMRASVRSFRANRKK